MSKTMTLEEAKAELRRTKDEVQRAVERDGMGFLTNATFRDWNTALRIWGDRVNGVWITTTVQGDGPRLSDEEAAQLIMERNEQFGTIVGVVFVEDGEDVDDMLEKLEPLLR